MRETDSVLPRLGSYGTASCASVICKVELVIIKLVGGLVLTSSVTPCVSNIFKSMCATSNIRLLVTYLLCPVRLCTSFSKCASVTLKKTHVLKFGLDPGFGQPFVTRAATSF